MAYSISLIENDTVILIKIAGHSYASRAFEYSKEALDYAIKTGIKKLLIDSTESKNIDTYSNVFQLANEDMKQFSDYRFQVRIAFLVAPDDHTHDFTETVFTNNNYKYKLFRDRDKAMEYLKESTDTK